MPQIISFMKQFAPRVIRGVYPSYQAWAEHCRAQTCMKFPQGGAEAEKRYDAMTALWDIDAHPRRLHHFSPKRCTIRAQRADGRCFYPGQMVSLWALPPHRRGFPIADVKVERTSILRMNLFEQTIDEAVPPARLSGSEVRQWISVGMWNPRSQNWVRKSRAEVEELARRDGFENTEDFFGFFVDRIDTSGNFIGQLIEW